MPPEPLEPRVASHQPQTDPPLVGRVVALLEVLLCSDFPTQLAVGATLAAFGYGPLQPTGQLRVGYIVGLSLIDTVLLMGLVLLFHGLFTIYQVPYHS